MALMTGVTGDATTGATTGGMMAGVPGAAAGAIIGGGVGLISNIIGGNANANKSLDASKALTDYNTEKAYEEQMAVWNATNYSQQVEQMQKAGLNPALMYKQGAGSGASIGNGAATGTVNAGITGNGAATTMAAMQGMMMKAQIANIEADTTQKLSQAKANEAIPQVQQSQIQQNTANTSLANANAQLTETENKLQQINLNYKTETYDTSVQQFKDAAGQTTQALQIMKNDATVSDATVQTKIDQQLENLAETYVNIQSKQAGITLTQKQVWQISQSVAQNWQYVSQGQQTANATTQNAETNIRQQATNEANQINTNAQGWLNITNTIRKIGIDQRGVEYLENRQNWQNFRDATMGISTIANSITNAIK